VNCPACGHENREGAQFCGGCGRPLAAEIGCPQCGSANPVGQRFCDSCGSRLVELADDQPERDPRSYTPKHLAEKILQSKSALEGERKQVTVLFADVKGSVELSGRVDPEEWYRIMDRFLQILADGVHRFEGTVNQYTGDGIMALFGAPITHEDHAQRACYAALRLRDELRRHADELRVERGLNVGIRIGLNSGEVVVGKIGDDLRMDYTAHGQTVGLASRVEQLAEAGRIYLTQHTARLVEGYFELRDLGESRVAGAEEPLRVYDLESAGPARTRLEVSRARGFTRFIGRVDEMATLELALHRALEGDGRVVGVVAEAGVGKSRLCLQFVERCRAGGTRVLEAHCPAYGKAVPFLPILELLRDAFGILAEDSDQVAREKIAGRLLLLDRAFDETLPLVFDFLGVPDPAVPVPRMDPEARQRQLFGFVRHLVEARGEREPAVVLFDDVHWIDAGSDAFLAQLVEAVRGTRTLLLLNFRPEYKADWVGSSYYQQLPLAPLGPEDIRELLRELLGDDPSVAELAVRIRERTGGNPFFIEEVVQSLAEAGSLEGEHGAYRLAAPVEEVSVPGTVQAVLAARIDRLQEREKHVLQTAAVIGKEFPEPLLEAVAELPGRQLAEALTTLRDAEFICEKALYPVAEYAFKHPLTQAVALESQLQDRRAPIHAAVARTLEEQHADELDERAGLLAHHWEAAGELLEAARWRARAARVVSRTDLVQAYLSWENVTDLLRDAEASEEATKLGVEAWIQLIVKGGVTGVSLEAQRRAFAAGTELVERAGDASGAAQLEAAFVDHLAASDQLAEATERLPRLLRVIAQSEDAELKVGMAHGVLFALFAAGNHKDARRVIDALEPLVSDDPDLGSGFSVMNPLCSLHAWRVWLLAFEGRLHEAREALEVALELARRHEPQAVIWIHCQATDIALYAGEPTSLARATEACELAEKLGGPYWQAVADWYVGLAHKTVGDLHTARSHLESGLEALRALRHTFQPWVMGSLAEVYLQLGDPERAGALAEEAVEVAQGRGTTVVEQSSLLSLSRVLLRRAGAEAWDTAATAIERGLALADQTGLVVLVPQFLVERAELARLRGDESERLHHLGEAHRLFVEMGATGHAERLARELGL